MEVFYLVLICLGILGLVVVIVGLLQKKPGEKPWKWLLGGAGALLVAIFSAILLFKRKNKVVPGSVLVEPPEKVRPSPEEIKILDEKGEEVEDLSKEQKEKETALDQEKENLDAKKEELDKRASETDALLEKGDQSSPVGHDAHKPDPVLADYLRNRG